MVHTWIGGSWTTPSDSVPATHSSRCYATPSGTVGRRFTSILAAECRGVLGRTRNSERPLVIALVVLTKTMGVNWAKKIRSQITRWMYLLERGLHAGLIGDAEAEGAVREGRAARRGEEEDEAVA